MGILLYFPNGIQSSPYSYLLDPNLWLEIHDVFTKEACTLLGLSVDSPLSVCINAGITVVPAFLNMSGYATTTSCWYIEWKRFLLKLV